MRNRIGGRKGPPIREGPFQRGFVFELNDFGDGGDHGEKLRADFHQPSQDHLAAVQLGSKLDHLIETRSGPIYGTGIQ